MPKEYILTTMFFVDDYSLRVTAAADHTRTLPRAMQSINAIPYDAHLSLSPDTVQNGSYAKDAFEERFECDHTSQSEAICAPRQATIDLGQVHRIDWLWWWPEPDKTSRVPQQWQIDVSLDGHTYEPAYSVSRFGYLFGTAYVINASCHAHRGEISLAPVEARFIRFHFENASRNNFLDEWAIELRLTALNRDNSTVDIQPGHPLCFIPNNFSFNSGL